MPRGDKSGPQGQDPVTGRCRGKRSPDDAPSVPTNQGGRGAGRRAGRDRGRGSGRGVESGAGKSGGRGRGRRP